MKLIDEARQCWRMLSMQAMGAALSLQAAWVALPDDLKSSIPDGWIRAATVVLLVLGMVGRVVKQDAVSAPSPQPEPGRPEGS